MESIAFNEYILWVKKNFCLWSNTECCNNLCPGTILACYDSRRAAVHDGAPPAQPIDLVWHNDQLWNSVVIGTLHGNPNPATLDAFYMISGQQPVAGAGPGDNDYNGGRWLPTMVSCASGPCGPFTDGEDVEAAIRDGTLQVDGTGTPFLCPLTNPNA